MKLGELLDGGEVDDDELLAWAQERAAGLVGELGEDDELRALLTAEQPDTRPSIEADAVQSRRREPSRPQPTSAAELPPPPEHTGLAEGEPEPMLETVDTGPVDIDGPAAAALIAASLTAAAKGEAAGSSPAELGGPAELAPDQSRPRELEPAESASADPADSEETPLEAATPAERSEPAQRPGEPAQHPGEPASQDADPTPQDAAAVEASEGLAALAADEQGEREFRDGEAAEPSAASPPDAHHDPAELAGADGAGDDPAAVSETLDAEASDEVELLELDADEVELLEVDEVDENDADGPSSPPAPPPAPGSAKEDPFEALALELKREQAPETRAIDEDEDFELDVDFGDEG